MALIHEAVAKAEPDTPEKTADTPTLASANAIWRDISQKPQDYDLDVSTYGHGLQEKFEEVFAARLVSEITKRLDAERQVRQDREDGADAVARGYARAVYGGGASDAGLAAYRADKAAGTLNPLPEKMREMSRSSLTSMWPEAEWPDWRSPDPSRKLPF